MFAYPLQFLRAPVVQRIEQIRPKDKMVVQFLPGAPLPFRHRCRGKPYTNKEAQQQ